MARALPSKHVSWESRWTKININNMTDELRTMLNEYGVEWSDRWIPNTNTNFKVNDITWHAIFRNGGIELHCEPLTPIQAIAATLGTGTCRLVETEHEQEIADEFGKGTFSYWAYDCSECGHENAEYGRFCAGCGRKVVDEWRA